MKTTKHVGLKLSVVMGFISIFFMAWLSFWVFGDLDLSLSAFVLQAFDPTSQSFWQWSRILGLLSYIALWLSVMTGLSISSQSSGFWFERGTALSWHQFFTWLGLIGALIHAGVLLKDSFLRPTIFQLIVPFTLQHEQLSAFAWFWAGLGQVAWYVLILIAIGSLFKQKFAKTVWKYLHGLALLAYVGVVAHGLLMGTDSKQLWIQGIYLMTNIVLMLVMMLRLIQLKLPVTAR